jgi:hypothetical protein
MASLSNSDPGAGAAADDDALGWGGDTDSSHVDGPPAAVQVSAEGKKAHHFAAEESAGAAERSPTPGVDPDVKPQVSPVLLVTYGILAGAYLLYLAGWVVAVSRSTITLPNILGEIMYQFGEFLAIASPLLWLIAVFILTRNSRVIIRLLWLVLGLALLVPWPFVLGGA